MKTGLITALCIICATCRAYGAMITLSAEMTSTPPSLSEGGGSATATVNDVTGEIAIMGTFGTFRHAVAASVHGPNNPPTDFLGPLVLPLDINPLPPLGNQGTFGGSGILDAAQLSQLLAGQYLVVVETQSSPGPTVSISGVLTVPEPGASTALLLGAVPLICGRTPQRRHGTA
jgi:hypothetical protein